MQGMYEDHGVRFMYPHTWEQEESEDGTRTLLTVSEPGGTAFAMISLDTECPAPVELADEALETLRADYPDLDSYPVIEEISKIKGNCVQPNHAPKAANNLKSP